VEGQLRKALGLARICSAAGRPGARVRYEPPATSWAVKVPKRRPPAVVLDSGRRLSGRRETKERGLNTWADLNHLQTGRYGEYFAKMAFVRAAFDVFNAEVDDKGIDFVLRINDDPPRYHDVQVKTVRSRDTYVFMRKDKFRLAPNLLLALVILGAGSEPEMYLIPASAWRNAKPPFADRDYDGKKSAPEYGLTLSPSNMMALEPFRFAGTIPA
jgi:hypothetical protein